jgi:hypothetical protein
MKQFVRSIPAILFLSVSSLSLIALAGCSSGSGGSSAPAGTAVRGIYAIQYSSNATTEQDSVLIFSGSATGSTTPTSTLALPSGFAAEAVAVGPQGQIYVGGSSISVDRGYGEILVYAAGASGSATPTVTLNGSAASTATFTYVNSLAVNSAGTLFVSSDDGTLEAFPSGFTASSAPTQYLTWGTQNDTIPTDPNFGEPNFGSDGGNIGVDTAGDVFYADPGYEVIDVFAAGATGPTATPVRAITGTNTNSFSGLQYIAVDGAGDVYVTNYNQSNDPAFNNNDGAGMNPGTLAAGNRMQAMGSRGASQLTAHPHVPDAPPPAPTGIIEFAAGATGNATPLNQISGSATNIVEPDGLALDASSNVYYADANGGYNADANNNGVFLPLLLETFSSSATGNVAPTASISSTGFTFGNNKAVTVY